MKIGLNMMLWTTNVTEEHFHIFEKLKAVGYDGVEIPILGSDPKPEEYEAIAKGLSDNGLQCSSSTAMPDENHNAISPDPAKRANAVNYMKQIIDCSKAVGADVLIGPFYQTLGIFTGNGPTEDEKKYAIETHKEMAEYASSQGVDLAVEFLNRFECHFLNTLGAAAELAKAVDNPAFGTMLDTFHANMEEKDTVAAIKEHGSTLKHVHISENDRGTPGRGHIQFDAIFKAFKEVGYDGWYTIEAFGLALPELAAACRIWRRFFESEEEVYTEGFKLINSLTK
ncbi:isomerase [bacterium E08(2017)]|nr:isomerase [bacterium E08(2017)]